MANNESRVLDVFGPNFLIETNGAVGVAGQLKYQLYSVTDGGVKYQQALYGNGLSTIDAEGTLEITSGFKNKPGRASLVAAALEGDAAINAEKGWVRIKGQNVVIDATNQLVLQATRIQIGHVPKFPSPSLNCPPTVRLPVTFKLTDVELPAILIAERVFVDGLYFILLLTLIGLLPLLALTNVMN